MNTWARILTPGLVLQAVVVGGGYATGRELVEFFLAHGLATGLGGLLVTTALFSIGGVVSFLLAYRFRTFDYHELSRLYLGRLAILFEVGYFALLLLVMAVVSAAAAELLFESFGTPRPINAFGFMAGIALLLLGSTIVERAGLLWSLSFYTTYGLMLGTILWRGHQRLPLAWASDGFNLATAVGEGFSYTGYNIVALPVLIFVARHFRSPREACMAGLLTGPLVLLPGFGFLLAMATFPRDILEAPLPVTMMLDELDMPVLTALVQLVILGALLKTGAGLMHGFNERMARGFLARGHHLPTATRPLFAIVITVLAATVADAVGLIDLIGRGYRYSSLYFLLVFLLPLLTIGSWTLIASRPLRHPPSS